MTKEQVLERLCIVVTKVGAEAFHEAEAHDCFCPVGQSNPSTFRVDEAVMKFIEDAVDEKIKKQASSTPSV